MIKKITFFIFLFYTFQIFGQDSENDLSKWHVNLGLNTHIAISKFDQGIPTDFLFDHGRQTFYPQLSFYGSYFFKPQWGGILKGNVGLPATKNSRNSDFENSIKEYYQDQFFVTANTGALYDQYENAEGVYFGIIHRKRKGKWVYLPQLLIGATSFRLDRGNVYLKEKNTNTIFQISYSSEKSVRDFFTVTPAFSVGYNFAKKWIINFDFLYGFFHMNIDIDEEKRNTFTEEIELQTITYKKNMHFINLGCSITRAF